MCASNKKFSRGEVYEAIQATVACVDDGSETWLFKVEHPEDGLYFNMKSKLSLAKYEINIIELGGELVKLSSLIQRAFTNNII